MKKILFSIAATLLIVGCNNDKVEEIIEQTTPQEVTVTFDYSFWESGSMTKSTGNELYTAFYNTYSKRLCIDIEKFTNRRIISYKRILG